MLYEYREKEQDLQPVAYDSFADLFGKEKDLENLLAKQLGTLYAEESRLMPIFQERQRQEEPDLCALDREGTLVIFELKRCCVPEDAVLQVMRYAQHFGGKSYEELNRKYHAYRKDADELAQAHAEAFQLPKALPPEAFNRRQKLVLVGNSSDTELIRAVEYWRSQGIDLDVLPYRFYEIAGKRYFEFFAKPYDVHPNPKDQKGILFDTNQSYHREAVWDMLRGEKVSAYGDAMRAVDSFRKDDYVFYYQAGQGVIAAGRIESERPMTVEAANERFHKVRFLVPPPKGPSEVRGLSAAEIKGLLGKSFYFASTAKSPFLTVEESKVLVAALERIYQQE